MFKSWDNVNAQNILSYVSGDIFWSETEFKEYEPRLKFEPRLNYCWFSLKFYLVFRDLSRRSIGTGFIYGLNSLNLASGL